MSSVINTNLASLAAQRNLSSAQSTLATSVQRLSSGLRINSGKDDAAGLAISQKMASQARSMSVATRNANDGISMIQTAEGAASAVNDIFLRMRELAVQASNDSLSGTERGYVKTELEELRAEANNIVGKTKFNGQKLVDGSFGISLQTSTSGVVVGTVAGTASAVSSVSVSGAKASTTYTISQSSTTVKLSDTSGNSQTLTLSAVTATAGGASTLNFNNLGVTLTLGSTAAETFTKNSLDALTVITNSTAGAELLVGADNAVNNKMTLNFTNLSVETTNTGDFANLRTALDTYATTQSKANANTLVDEIDDAITKLNGERATYGAWQNRLDFTVGALGAAEENTRAGMSRIQDTDYAAETATLTKGQILQQAGAAMLAQANQMPNVVLSLLK